MDNKPVDLRDSLVGHVILWTKNWYHKSNESRTLERMNEVINSITGMPAENELRVHELLSYLMEAAAILKIPPRQIAEAITRETAIHNKRVTFYNARLLDEIPMNELIAAYASIVSCGQINDGKRPFVLLPSLNEAVCARCDLKPYETRL